MTYLILHEKEYILVWTPSMHIVVNDVVSSCHTEGYAPTSVKNMLAVIQNPVGASIMECLAG